MAPVRKSRKVNKRFTNETSPGNSRKTKQRKKKLSDNLGPQWTTVELERFYEAYRKHGKEWKKVAAAIRNSRSVDMVEALFNINRAYLSLPEGTASVAGLIAMMTDHYSVMEGSGNEGEGHDASEVPRKQQKHKRAKPQFSDLREEVDAIASTDGCLTFLKQTRANGTQRFATGKRTPRIPVHTSYMRDDREGSTPPNNRANDDVAHFLTLELTDASRKKGSSKVSESPDKRTELSDTSPIKSWGKMSQTRKAQSKHCESSMFEEWVGSSRERKLESDNYAALSMDMEGVGEMETPRKGKRFYKKKVKVEETEGNDSDENGEACSATEGLRIKSQRRKAAVEALRGKYSPRSTKKKDNKLTFGDEFDALQALAELSASMLPATLMESESSAQLKEERTEHEFDEKASTLDANSTSSHGEQANAEPDDSLLHAISALEHANKRKPQPSRHAPTDFDVVPTGKLQLQTSCSLRRKRKSKVLGNEASADFSQNKSEQDFRLEKTLPHIIWFIVLQELSQDENNMKSLVKTKRSGQGQAPSKQLKTAKVLEESTSTSDKKRPAMDVSASTKQVSDLGPANLSQKPPSRRKKSLKKSLLERVDFSETIHKTSLSSRSPSEQELLKDKLSTNLSYPLARRRCIFEWFYSAIDHPWFAKMEFVDYLNHVGLGHIPRLTRLEWSVIKSCLGRPRRLSERFLQEEREKLIQYRESVRKHYTELRTGAREGLPTDLSRPLSVGNRVIAIHPKTRDIHDGKILTVDHNQCNVLFEDLGVELVNDIDCMPTNPMEYMPEGLRRQIDKCFSMKKVAQPSGNSNLGLSVIFPPCGFENVSFSMNPSLNQGDRIAPILHGKVSTDTSSPQESSHSYVTTYRKARKADIQRAHVLQHALDEKEMETDMLEIFKSSKTRAQAMVDAAIKAASSVKDGEDVNKMIQEALDLIGKHQPLQSSRVNHHEHINSSIEHHHNSSPSDASETIANSDFNSQDGLEKNEAQMPSELITSCVATWLMIQMCTERQYPLADVAQLIDAAVTSLKPRCPQNLSIYREIQTCMGRIKTQILAQLPT